MTADKTNYWVTTTTDDECISSSTEPSRSGWAVCLLKKQEVAAVIKRSAVAGWQSPDSLNRPPCCEGWLGCFTELLAWTNSQASLLLIFCLDVLYVNLRYNLLCKMISFLCDGLRPVFTWQQDDNKPKCIILAVSLCISCFFEDEQEGELIKGNRRVESWRGKKIRMRDKTWQVRRD